MTPKQRRLMIRIKHQRNNKFKKYFIGIILIAGLLKLLSEGLKLL